MDAAVHLILRDADPLGLITATRDNWTGIAHAMPMSDYESMKHILNKSGVYVLIGIEEGKLEPIEAVYIGEADNISSRLTSAHKQIIRDDVTWKRVIIFTSTTNDLHKAHIKWIEHKLVSMARNNTSTYKLYNSTAPTEPNLPDFDKVFIESFIEKMLVLYPILGVHAFKNANNQDISSNKVITKDLYYIKIRNDIYASGHNSSNGFTILSGSKIKTKGTDTQGISVKRIREEIMNNRAINTIETGWYVLDEDIELTSLSTASNLVLGNSTNGRDTWKNSDGQSYNDLHKDNI